MVVWASARATEWCKWQLTALLFWCGLAGQMLATERHRIEAALSSGKPVALIGVPPAFLDAGGTTEEGEVETRADWRRYLNRWASTVSARFEIVVVPIEILGGTVELGEDKPDCVALFRRTTGEALRFDEHCVVGEEIYEAATSWLDGGALANWASSSLTPSIIRIKHRCSPTNDVRVPAVVGMDYDRARQEILAAGWKPVRIRDPDGSSREVEEDLYGNEAEFLRRGYVEVEMCAWAGLAPCIFRLRDRVGNGLTVYTAGEENTRSHAVVTGPQLSCR